jgi:hypothetical protein
MKAHDSRTSQPIAPVLLHLGADLDAEIESDFENWCGSHIADNLKLPGFVSARRFRRSDGQPATGTSPVSLTLYQLADVSALETPQYKGRTVSMPPHFSGRIRAQRALYRELGVSPGVRHQAIGPAILQVTVDVEPEWRARFLDWYVNVHVAAVLDAPGMLGVRRFENVLVDSDGPLVPGQHTYCTLYEMEKADVIARPETLAAASRGACPPELAPHRVAFNQTYEEVFRASAD